MGTESQYDPNAPADSSAGIFGLPDDYSRSRVIFLPIPWEATTSYGGGTVHGPEAIIHASSQLDLFDLDVKDPYREGFHCLPVSPEIKKLNSEAKALADPIKEAFGEVRENPLLQSNLRKVNECSLKLNQFVHEKVLKILKDGKIPGLIGGDHSIPIGAFDAAASVHGDFGILHFDAHSDTRNAYMGFTDSHASIMRNAANRVKKISKFVQVGIRDFCQEEYEFTRSQGNRFVVYYDQKIMESKIQGIPFSKTAHEIVNHLPEKVWVSFDIDGLDPRFCPHTGTPVPGGLDYSEAIHILRTLAKSGRKIIGFDVVEVAPPLSDDGTPLIPVQAADEWDANVGMRLIYKLSALSLASNQLAKWQIEH